MESATWIRNSGVSLNCAQSVKMIVLVQNLRFLSDEKMQKRPFEVGQTHLNNSSETADGLFEYFLPYCVVDA